MPIVSRGELIEIGGSFRLPDIMARAGARLVEVGTTNRTHLKDYEGAVGEGTGLILKAHTSNYLIQGFTKSVSAPELAALARARSVPFVHDLGSGALVDLARYGLPPEPTVRESLAEGADLVTFSGDKLLGGPQAGIVAGRKDLVSARGQEPHEARAAPRQDQAGGAGSHPQALPRSRSAGRRRCRRSDTSRVRRPRWREAASRLRQPIAAAVGDAYGVDVADCTSQVGSGALPLETLPSAGIAIAPVDRKGAGRRLEALVSALRGLAVPVLGHVKDGALILDLRCLDDEAEFLAQLAQLPARLAASEATHVPA